jgi:hypothetical protein
MATSFSEVYDYFFAKITTYNEYDNLTEDELNIELMQLLKASFAECLSFKDISADYTNSTFNRDLTDLEMNIISYNMVVHYLNPKINNIELLKQSLSSKDYQFYSQANHLRELMNLRQESSKQFQYWINRYGYYKSLQNPVRKVAYKS